MRRVVALAVGLVLCVLLLGGGWLAATTRERDALVERERERLARAAEVVRGVVDESLGELREREDARSFNLYSHFYSPPDVLAISDPVAISPLAREPSDARLIGHFQVDPDGAVRTPYSLDAREEHPRSQRIRAIVEADAYAELRALAVGGPTDGASPEQPATPEGELLSLNYGNPRNTGSVSTVDQNYWGNAQAQDIYAAQAGDPRASERVIQRGRQVPTFNRRNVTWEEAQQQAPSRRVAPRQQAAVVATRPSEARIQGALEEHADAVRACVPERQVQVRLRLRASDGTPSGLSVDGVDTVEARGCVTRALRTIRLGPIREDLVVEYRYGAGEAPRVAEGSRDNLVQGTTEVVYTPMTFRAVDGSWVLHRLVTHEGTSVVQGLLLDRERLVDEWIPALVERHFASGAEVRVVPAGAGSCSVRRPASAVLEGLELCFAPSALEAVTADLDAELGWQVAALVALLAVALLAAVLIVNATRRAEALSRQKSAFVSAVSHELRTPLTTLRMHAEMLDQDMVSEERRPKVHRELVHESVRLARLVDNVLSLSKLEEGRRRLAPEDGDLRAHVHEVVESQRARVEERGFTLTGPDHDEPLEALFDRQAVEQIVTNLIENAVKYGRGDELVIDVAVEPREGAPTLLVRDRGPGVPEAEREKVFERFHRVDREETAHAPGTGIGLSLVAELAAAHGGDASVHAREGGGCEVRVRLGPAA